MHVRKLVKSGHSSLVTALPSEWIKKNKLKAGDLVYVKDDANKLSIETEFKQPETKNNEVVINIDNKDETSIVYDINSAYLDNYKYIIIKGRTLSKVIKQIKKAIRDLVALELVEESSEKIVARSFLNIYDSDPKLVLRRMDNIIRSMFIDAKDVDRSLVETIIGRDEEINRLSYLMLKILKGAYLDSSIQKSMNIEPLDILRFWEVNIHLEKMGDRVKNIANIAAEISEKNKKIFINILSRFESLYKEVMTAFYNFSKDKADNVLRKREDLKNDVKRFIEKTNSVKCSQIAVNLFNMAANINNIGRAVRYLD